MRSFLPYQHPHKVCCASTRALSTLDHCLYPLQIPADYSSLALLQANLNQAGSALGMHNVRLLDATAAGGLAAAQAAAFAPGQHMSIDFQTYLTNLQHEQQQQYYTSRGLLPVYATASVGAGDKHPRDEAGNLLDPSKRLRLADGLQAQQHHHQLFFSQPLQSSHQPMLQVVPLQLSGSLDDDTAAHLMSHNLIPLVLSQQAGGHLANLGPGLISAGPSTMQLPPPQNLAPPETPTEILEGRPGVVQRAVEGLKWLMHSSEELARKKRQQRRRAELNQRRALPYTPEVGMAADGSTPGSAGGNLDGAGGGFGGAGSALSQRALSAHSRTPRNIMASINHISQMPSEEKRALLVSSLRRAIPALLDLGPKAPVLPPLPPQIAGANPGMASMYTPSVGLIGYHTNGTPSAAGGEFSSQDGIQMTPILKGKENILQSDFFQKLRDALPALVSPAAATQPDDATAGDAVSEQHQQQQHQRPPVPHGGRHHRAPRIAADGTVALSRAIVPHAHLGLITTPPGMPSIYCSILEGAFASTCVHTCSYMQCAMP